MALDLLYPPQCALCGRGGSFLCHGCEGSLPPAAGPRCPVCWLPVWPGRGCARCTSRPIALTSLRSPYLFQASARDLVLKFKFGSLSVLAELMAPPMASMVDWPVDVVTPVPLTAAHDRKRGYNQSRLLAQRIAAALGVENVAALRRPGSAPTQAKSSAEQRWLNVDGAFEMRRGADVAGRAVLLVDDVATTGATLDACARELLTAGAREVSAVTFARED